MLLCDLLALQELLEKVRPDDDDLLDAADGGGRRRRRQLHVVCLVGSYGMRRTAKAFLRSMLRRAFSFELLIADEHVSAALVQIATHPHNSQVFEHLLLNPRGGTQLTMVPANAFGLVAAGPAAFGAVAERALAARALAVGYRRYDGRLLLAPAADDVVDWCDGDELVVIMDQDG